MVNAQTGVLIECDAQMKQFLLHLDETNAIGCKFILQDLDSTHIFIDSGSLNRLTSEIDDLMEKINFVEI